MQLFHRIILNIFIFIIFSRGINLQAQGTNNKLNPAENLGISSELSLSSYREDLLVPISFDGPLFAIGSTYNCWTESSYYQIRLSIGMGYLQNRFSHEAFVLKLSFFPTWLEKIENYKKFGEVWAGISIPMQMNNLFLASWDEAHLYWLTVYSLGPALGWKKEIFSNNQIFVQLSIPIISWISRPPSYRYNKQDALTHVGFHFSEPNSSLHFESLEDYRSIAIQINLIRNKCHSGWNFGFEFQYDYFRNPKSISRINTSLLLAYMWGI